MVREVIETNVDGNKKEICGLPFFRNDADATEFLADGINIRGGGWGSMRVGMG